jgi:hypothetical protein
MPYCDGSRRITHAQPTWVAIRLAAFRLLLSPERTFGADATMLSRPGVRWFRINVSR